LWPTGNSLCNFDDQPEFEINNIAKDRFDPPFEIAFAAWLQIHVIIL